MPLSREKEMLAWIGRPAERVVLESCRLHSGQPDDAAHAKALFCDLLGEGPGRAVLAEFERFMAALGPCNSCPLRGFPAGSTAISRDEALIIALLAGLQHGDEPVVETCLAQLACMTRCRDVEAAAAAFALTLRCFGQRLVPIPLRAVEDLLRRSRSHTVH